MMQGEGIRSAQNKQTIALPLALWLRVAVMTMPALLSWAVPLFDNDDVLSQRKDKLHQRFEKERETSTLPLSWCNHFIYGVLICFILVLAFFWIANNSFFFSFWNETTFICALVEILWALSDPSPVTGIYLLNPSPFPSSPTTELTHTLPTNDSRPC